MKLYQDNQNFSANVKRVKVLCNEVGASVEHVPMDFMKGEWQKPEYLAKNPMGKVPTIEDDGYVLWESPAICYYLASKYGERGLIPGDLRGKTEMFRWVTWNASHLETSVMGVAFEKLIKPLMNQTPDTTRIETCTKDWKRFAPVLNAQLEGKNWVLGSNYSIVDIILGTTVETAVVRCGFDINEYTHLKAWYTRLTTREAWVKATNHTNG